MHLSGTMFFLFMALVAGISMAFQGAINSGLSKITGLWEATFFVHASATIALAGLLFGLKIGKGNLSDFLNAPWYLYIGGFIGVVITYTVVISIAKLGAAVATTAIIVGQVLTAVIIDCLGLFGLEHAPFNWFKVLGVALLAAGAKLLLN